MSFKAFILEDDLAFAQILSVRIQGWREDAEIIKAHTVADGRRILDSTEESFNLAILDQFLPDGVGVDLSEHPALQNTCILAVSADESPELPGRTVRAGARHFLAKPQVAAPLFIPLLEALVERNEFEQQARDAAMAEAKMKSIETLLATLRHEINNPLGAVLGAAYLIEQEGSLAETQAEAVRLIESSGQRINHVLNKLCQAVELEEVTKANEQVFHVPGDKEWPKNKGKD